MSQLPSDFEKIVIIAQQFYESEHKTANAAIRYAVERCYALANKPVRELTDAEVDAIYDAMPGGPNKFCIEWGFRTFARELLSAHVRKQQEPETVTVQVRFWRYTDSAKGRCEPRSFTSDEDDLTAKFPSGYTNAEWLGPAQTIEVKLP